MGEEYISLIKRAVSFEKGMGVVERGIEDINIIDTRIFATPCCNLHSSRLNE